MRPKDIRLGHVAARPGAFPRDGRPQVAMMGRSNVGKSSLLNSMLGRQSVARVSKTPGRTREINFFLLDEKMYLVDLPGYGYAKVPAAMRRKWGELMESYLDQPDQPCLAIHLVDARHDPTELDLVMNEALRGRGIPYAVALTKGDKLSGSAAGRATSRARKILELDPEEPVVLTSAKNGKGISELVRVMLRVLDDTTDRANQA